MLQFVRVHIIRSEYKLGILSNKKLLLAVGVSFLLQMAVIYTPASAIFQTVALDLLDWAFLIGVSLALLVISMIVNKILPKLNIAGD